MKISDLAREYAKRYIKFLIDNDITISSKDAYEMFRFVICRLYGFKCGGTFPLLVMHYDECYEVLSNIKEMYSTRKSIDKKAIIECSCVYTLVFIQYCAGNIKVRNVGLDLLNC